MLQKLKLDSLHTCHVGTQVTKTGSRQPRRATMTSAVHSSLGANKIKERYLVPRVQKPNPQKYLPELYSLRKTIKHDTKLSRYYSKIRLQDI